MSQQRKTNVGRWFEGPDLLQIAMPMGGIGAGCICLNGTGGIVDFSIRNLPATTALPDNHGFADAAFAILHIKGDQPITRLVEGQLSVEKIYDQGLQAQGYRKGGYEGLPRFEQCKFGASFPTGEVQLNDPHIPVKVNLTGWSPFIPLDDRTSGMPAAVLEYKLTNTSAKPVEFEFSCHLSHLARGKAGWKGTRNAIIDGGVHLYNTEHPMAETHASASLSVICHTPTIKAMWMRGRWFDWIASLWQELSQGTFRPNTGNTDRDLDGHNGASILLPGKLQPGESITYPIVMTWYFPNVFYSVGQADYQPAKENEPAWRNYYAGQWKDAADVAADLRTNFASIRQRTMAFRDALHESTLPVEAIDAITSNLAILKSPTILRQQNGNMWAWEGCFTQTGCCHGTCTHVWNYAQAIPHLFPALERTLREQELLRSMKENGNVVFRAALPDGPPEGVYTVSGPNFAAADGQLGGILKVYRDWQISGDRDWLQTLYPHVQKSLKFCIKDWDPENKGALFEPHHNTYDIEFWGPDPMCTSVYLGALSAMVEMAREMNDPEIGEYETLLQSGRKYCDENLFNGEYFQQKVMWNELKDRSFAKLLESSNSFDAQALRVMNEEGPSYQYGPGCLSDAVIGMWMAKLYGLDYAMTPANIRATLAAIFKHNFKPDLSTHACTQRPGYATGHEPGLILCTWPTGNRPTLPFVYSDEVWTGIEYQVASHLIEEGMVDQGLTIVKAARSRYDGHKRNPFNEYECGSYYARAMASYALLQALSGFRYSAAKRTLWFGPKGSTRPWKSFFSTATAYGSISLDDGGVSLELLAGELAVDTLLLSLGSATRDLHVNKVIKAGPIQRIASL
jgi:uncharacterized protein (DUF608 family)